jgi:hypothetical protein
MDLFDPNLLIPGLSTTQSQDLRLFFDDCLADRTPIPWSDRGIEWLAIAEKTGIPVRRLRSSAGAAEAIKKIADIVGRAAVPKQQQPSAPMTYGELDTIASERRRAKTQGRKSSGQMVSNVQTALRRWMKDLNLSASTLVGTELGPEFAKKLEELTGKRRDAEENEKTISKFASEMRFVQRCYAAQCRAAQLDGLDFTESLRALMQQHGESHAKLAGAVASGPDRDRVRKNIDNWAVGTATPLRREYKTVGAIEDHYELTPGTLVAKIPRGYNSLRLPRLENLKPGEQKRISPHLPVDILSLPKSKREEIIDWVVDNILRQNTPYAQWKAKISQHPYAIKFPGLPGEPSATAVQVKTNIAPEKLHQQVTGYVRYKLAKLPPLKRADAWKEETAKRKVPEFGRFFGAITADPGSPVRGLGLDHSLLDIALLTVPKLVDWSVEWRRERRTVDGLEGEFVPAEVNFLNDVAAMLEKETKRNVGWIRAHPELADGLNPIPGILDEETIAIAKQDWNAYCDKALAHCRERARQIKDIAAECHRDSFVPIEVVLDAPRPLDEYAKILSEMRRRAPHRGAYPLRAAEHRRAYLVMKVALATGYRQRMLREMLVVPKGQQRFSDGHLIRLRRAMLYYDPQETQESGTVGAWVVHAPVESFKNPESSFFKEGGAHRVVLEDIGGLYADIEGYITDDIPVLLGGAQIKTDVLFVKTLGRGRRGAEYSTGSFHNMFSGIIEAYGIYNPFTGQGAIAGLMPHGPHAIRDVIATHVLKVTGSWDLAADAIQDSVAMVRKRYAKYGPADRARAVAKITNQSWRNAA